MLDKPASSMGSNRRENSVRIRLARREGFFSSVAKVMTYNIKNPTHQSVLPELVFKLAGLGLCTRPMGPICHLFLIGPIRIILRRDFSLDNWENAILTPTTFCSPGLGCPPAGRHDKPFPELLESP